MATLTTTIPSPAQHLLASAPLPPDKIAELQAICGGQVAGHTEHFLMPKARFEALASGFRDCGDVKTSFTHAAIIDTLEEQQQPRKWHSGLTCTLSVLDEHLDSCREDMQSKKGERAFTPLRQLDDIRRKHVGTCTFNLEVRVACSI